MVPWQGSLNTQANERTSAKTVPTEPYKNAQNHSTRQTSKVRNVLCLARLLTGRRILLIRHKPWSCIKS